MDIEKAKESLITYLERDKKGLRRALLSILLDGEFTIPEIREKLNEMGFSITLQGTSALVGFAYSRLYPILSRHYHNDKFYYSIKPYFIPIVKSLLETFFISFGNHRSEW